MKNFFKGKIATVIILIATFILAGVAIFTAIRLYQLRQTSVAPNAPESQPRAQEVTPTQPPTNNCSLSFTLSVTPPTPTPTGSVSPTPTATPHVTPTPTVTATPTATATATPIAQCNTSCTTNSGCPSNLICSIPAGATTGNCRNTSCTSATNCVCATATPHATATATPAALPQSGTDWPTTLGIGIGILTIIGSLILAL